MCFFLQFNQEGKGYIYIYILGNQITKYTIDEKTNSMNILKS